jgi:anti-anti-sigma factor
MFSIEWGGKGDVVLTGRWDATQTEKAETFFKQINQPSTVDFKKLDYISSAGLGILLMTQKRLMGNGGSLTLVNLNPHISEVFRYAGLERVFVISKSPGR